MNVVADEPCYIVPYRTTPTLYRNLSGWLHEVARFGPPMATAGLRPRTAAVRRAETRQVEQKRPIRSSRTEAQKKALRNAAQSGAAMCESCRE